VAVEHLLTVPSDWLARKDLSRTHGTRDLRAVDVGDATVVAEHHSPAGLDLDPTHRTPREFCHRSTSCAAALQSRSHPHAAVHRLQPWKRFSQADRPLRASSKYARILARAVSSVGRA